LADLVGVYDRVYVVSGLPAVYIEGGALVIADLHFGYEEALAGDGVFLPRVQLRKALELLSSLSRLGLSRRLVIAGDIKHSFSRLLWQERREVSRFIEEAFNHGFNEVVVVRGNHDNYISHVVRKSGGEFVEDPITFGRIAIAHGHRNEDVGDILVIGHEHPAIQVTVGGSRVKLPIFLMIPLKDGRRVLVLPPAGSYQTGNIVTLERESYLSPIIRSYGVLEDADVVIFYEETGAMPIVKLGMLKQIIV